VDWFDQSHEQNIGNYYYNYKTQLWIEHELAKYNLNKKMTTLCHIEWVGYWTIVHEIISSKLSTYYTACQMLQYS
jgi:hypothetical protein